MDEGYIKFGCEWELGPAPNRDLVAELNPWRQRFRELRLVGQYENGIGFGNLSLRVPGLDEFVITATATGHLASLSADHYTRVTRTDAPANKVWCTGPARASSESMTHATIYRLAPDVNAVVHAHGPSLWRLALNRLPTTAADVPYGTPEMANEVQRLFRDTTVSAEGFFAMAGHEEGVVSFGATLSQAAQRLLDVAARVGARLPEERPA